MLLNSDVFIDRGANIGLYTCLAQSLGKRTVSFEPQPINLEFLFTNLTNNGWHHAEIIPI
jgi:FkbM family methyltransferase